MDIIRSKKKCPLYGDVRFIECLHESQLVHGGGYGLNIPVKYTFLRHNKAIEWIEKKVTKIISEMLIKTVYRGMFFVDQK